MYAQYLVSADAVLRLSTARHCWRDCSVARGLTGGGSGAALPGAVWAQAPAVTDPDPHPWGSPRTRRGDAGGGRLLNLRDREKLPFVCVRGRLGTEFSVPDRIAMPVGHRRSFTFATYYPGRADPEATGSPETGMAGDLATYVGGVTSLPPDAQRLAVRTCFGCALSECDLYVGCRQP